MVAALLAAKGFGADESILEGTGSLLQVFVGKEYDPVKLTAELGSPFSMVSPGVKIKAYPACGTAHKSINAMLELIKEHPIHAEDVAEVECKVAPFIKEVLRYSRRKTGLEGKFSMHYCMAAVLLDGEATLEQFTDERVRAPKAQGLVARVKCVELETAEEVAEPIELPQIVTVRLRDGTQYSHQVPFAKGEAQNPMSSEEVELKFRDCARSVLSPSDLDRMVELVSNLESLEDISELADIVTFSKIK